MGAALGLGDWRWNFGVKDGFHVFDHGSFDVGRFRGPYWVSVGVLDKGAPEGEDAWGVFFDVFEQAFEVLSFWLDGLCQFFLFFGDGIC